MEPIKPIELSPQTEAFIKYMTEWNEWFKDYRSNLLGIPPDRLGEIEPIAPKSEPEHLAKILVNERKLLG